MTIKEWLKRDKISLGILLGLIIPVPAGMLLMVLLRLVQTNLHIFSRVRITDMILLGLALNLVMMRYYLVKLKFEKTGKSMMIITVFLILMFFLFLRNSSFTLPF